MTNPIEEYLGKDHYPNLHWIPEIPVSWAIPAKPGMAFCKPTMANSKLVINNVLYEFNNLGYRSNFDYIIEDLKDRKIILLLGDSDVLGFGIDVAHIFSTEIAKNLPEYCVMNLGIIGLSSDAMARIGVQVILALQSAVKHTCVLWPLASSREVVSKKFRAGVNPNSKILPNKDWFTHIDWVSNNYNYHKNRLLLEQTSLANKACFHDLMINRYNKNSPVTYNLHSSPETNAFKFTTYTEFTAETHLAIANYYIEKIKNLD